MLTSGLKACFFSRPRRFGKSLTVTTLESIFQGKKHLFGGLAIAATDYAWPVHPVVRLDMKYAAHPNLEDMKTGLSTALQRIAADHKVSLEAGLVEDMFMALVTTLREAYDAPVVILIDEYDKPMIDNLNNMEEALKIQGLLKRFYGVLKSADEHLRFVFITGVSKFSKVSVFSDLNHLTDLTMDTRYATLVGMTETELLANYKDYIDQLAVSHETDRAGILEKIRHWYNGYRFSKQDLRVYNPWSTLSLFQSQDFIEHWYTTGIPKMLVDIINRNPDDFLMINPADFDLTMGIPAHTFEAYEIEKLQLMPLLFQSGFLTIKTYDAELNLYHLGYPNFEVRQAFVRMVLDQRIAPPNTTNQAEISQRIRVYLRKQDFEALFKQLNLMIASIPGILHTPKESYYHSLIHMVFQTSGLTLRSEEWVAGGRIDTVIEEPDMIYIIEFKFDGTAAEAIVQIRQRHYAAKFQGKPVTAIGIAVDCEAKAIGEWDVVAL